MTDALHYENFLRRAFGLGAGVAMLERNGDPARMADTDAFTDQEIAAVKASVAYGMLIIARTATEANDDLPDAESDRIEAFAARVIGATSLTEIDSLIREFEETVERQYFRVVNGVLTAQ